MRFFSLQNSLLCSCILLSACASSTSPDGIVPDGIVHDGVVHDTTRAQSNTQSVYEPNQANQVIPQVVEQIDPELAQKNAQLAYEKVSQEKKDDAHAKQESVNQKKEEKSVGKIPSTSIWYPLYSRLVKDGIKGADVDDYFMRLEGQFSAVPMGTKVTELYNINFKERPKTPTPPKPDTSPNDTGIPRPWYKGIVDDKYATKCRAFIKENQTVFNRVEEKYNISENVIAALMFVETRLGTFLGSHNPMVNLASMSNSTKIEQIPEYIAKLPLAKEKREWILGKMKEKSDWAYIELVALIKYCRENKLDPFELPSSVYGALGYGQFMPTNIPRFAIDGDSDGVINLFTPADAIMSTANFLAKHGWTKENMTLDKKIKVLKRYNYSTTYANTIMALSVLTSRIE